MAEDLKVGDQVHLKNLGHESPNMVVILELEVGQVTCSWLDKENHQVTGRYPPAALDRGAPPERPVLGGVVPRNRL